MVKDATYTFLCWVLGFLATARTDWAVQQALKLQHRYPKAFASRLPERSGYPSFLRALGIILLLFAGIFTFRTVFDVIVALRR